MAFLVTLRQPLDDLRHRAVAWITRGEQADPRSIRLTRRRIYILPTRAGYGFALILIVMLLGATNYSNSMAFVLTFLLISLGANTMWQTHRNLLGLEVIVEGASPVFAGQQARVRIAINNSHRQPRYGLRLSVGSNPAHTVDVPARGQVEVDLPLATSQRGIITVGRIRIDTRYPLALFEAWSWPTFTSTVTVYPKPATDAPFDDRSGTGGDHGQPLAVDGDEFAGLRKHVPGDSLRQVAWKAVARTGRWLTKEFQSHQSEDRWLRWEDVAVQGVEQRLSVLCRWVLDAHRQGAPYGLSLPGRTIPPAATESHRHECLKALALFGADDRKSQP